MRIADYLVSCSLQINNRALRYLAECETHALVGANAEDVQGHLSELNSVFAENLLAKDSRRLCSQWWLLKPVWNEISSMPAALDSSPILVGADGTVIQRPTNLKEHVRALQSTANTLTDIAASQSLALRLASLADNDHDAGAILRVARRLSPLPAPSWDEINALFAADSAAWRELSALREMDDSQIVRRMAATYRKGYRLGRRIDDEQLDVWLNDHHDKLYKWVGRSTHAMELLRPGLSDSSRAQLWYLDKMFDTLRMREGFIALRTAMREMSKNREMSKKSDMSKKGKLSKKVLRKDSEQGSKSKWKKSSKSSAKSGDEHLSKADLVTARACVEQQIDKMNRRVVRLSDGCFEMRPGRCAQVIERAAQRLGVDQISFLSRADMPAQTQEPALVPSELPHIEVHIG